MVLRPKMGYISIMYIRLKDNSIWIIEILIFDKPNLI